MSAPLFGIKHAHSGLWFAGFDAEQRVLWGPEPFARAMPELHAIAQQTLLEIHAEDIQMSERFEERGSGTIPGTVEWDKAPAWAQFYARDRDGGQAGWWYTDRPYFNARTGRWIVVYGEAWEAPSYGGDGAWGLVARHAAVEPA